MAEELQYCNSQEHMVFREFFQSKNELLMRLLMRLLGSMIWLPSSRKTWSRSPILLEEFWFKSGR